MKKVMGTFDDRTLLSRFSDKISDLAEYEGHFINGEVLYLIRQAIKQYEKDHEQKQ